MQKIETTKMLGSLFLAVKIIGLATLIIWTIYKSFFIRQETRLSMWGCPVSIPMEIELSPSTALEMEWEKIKEEAAEEDKDIA